MMTRITQVWDIIGPRFQVKAIVLLVIIIALAMMQAAGLGAVLPVVAVIVKPDLILNNPWGAKLYALFGSPSIAEFSLQLIIAYGILYLLLQAANMALIAFQSRFNNALMLDLSTRVMQGYLNKDYEFYLGSNSSVLVKNIVSEIVTFASQIVKNTIDVASKIFIISAIFVVLAMMNAFVAFVILVAMSIFLMLFFLIFKKRLSQWASLRIQFLSGMHKQAHQAMSGIKEIKVHGCEQMAVQAYALNARQYADLNNKHYILSASVGNLVSAVFFGGVLVVMFILKHNGVELGPYIPLMTVYGVGLSRLLPMGTQMFSAIVNIRYASNTVDIVLGALDDVSHVAREDVQEHDLAPFSRLIEFDAVHYRYPNADNDALGPFSLEISFGSKVALVGGSGAGKSTAINALLGLFPPSSGLIMVDGVPIDNTNVRAWHRQIGFVPQSVFLMDTTLKANIAFGIDVDDIDEDRLDQVLRLARLDELINKLPDGVETQVGERGVKLSGGEQQRVGIARALYRNPRILVLDEPTSALDALTEKRIVQDLLALDEDLTIIIVTHRLSSVRFCDKLIVFDDGRIVGNGTYEALLETCPAFNALADAWDDKE